MTAEHALSGLCDDIQHSVDESGPIDDSKQIVSWLNRSQDDVTVLRKPLQAHFYICRSCPLNLQSPQPSIHTYHNCYYIALPYMIYSTLLFLVESNEHSLSITESLRTIECLKINGMHSGC
jgi:hypothetical protein